jgi:hypothetical protein
VPTACKLANILDHQDFLNGAYAAFGTWDSWGRRNCETKNAGRIEAFCAFDVAKDTRAEQKFRTLVWIRIGKRKAANPDNEG